MANTIRSIARDERLTLVGHLDELRSRLIITLVAVGVAFAVCFWQNHALLRVLNRPLATQTSRQARDGHGPLGAAYGVQQSARDIAVQLRTVVGVLDAGGSVRTQAAGASLAGVRAGLTRDIRSLSAAPQGERPVTLGIGEPFASTITVALVFALMLALPVIVFELYGFLAPALDPEQRRGVRPWLLAVPALFAAGVLFGYEVVLPAAVRFFQNFNSTQFNVLVQASPYYKFAAIMLLAMGLVFEVPVAVLMVTRAGIVTPRTLRRNRRYALAACGAVAAFLPGDAIALLLETAPLYLLFEAGVLIASIVERRRPPSAASAASAASAQQSA